MRKHIVILSLVRLLRIVRFSRESVVFPGRIRISFGFSDLPRASAPLFDHGLSNLTRVNVRQRDNNNNSALGRAAYSKTNPARIDVVSVENDLAENRPFSHSLGDHDNRFRDGQFEKTRRNLDQGQTEKNCPSEPGVVDNDSYQTSKSTRVRTNTIGPQACGEKKKKPWPRLKPSGTYSNNVHVG